MILLAAAAAQAATLEVGTTYATITDALAAAVDGDTIHVPAGTWTEGLVLYGKNVTLLGDGVDVTLLAPPADTTGVAAVHRETARIEGLTIQPDGGQGVVATSASLVLVSVRITGAGSDVARGGALAVDGGDVELEDVTIDDATAAYGGAIYAIGGATVRGTGLVLAATSATYGGAVYAADGAGLDLVTVDAADGYAAAGGGFAYVDDASLTVTDTTLDAPTAHAGLGSAVVVTGHGALALATGTLGDAAFDTTAAAGAGAIHADDGATVLLDGLDLDDSVGTALTLDGGATATLTAVRISGATTDGSGAAIRAVGAATLTTDACSFTDGVAGDDGGAVSLEDAALWTDLASSFVGNTAGARGGAIALATGASATLVTAELSGNTARDDGGALYVDDGTLVLEDADVVGNETSTGDGGALALRDGSATIEGGDFSGNTAVLGDGGTFAARAPLTLDGVALSDSSADGDGGALHATDTVVVRNSTLRGATAGDDGGALWVSGSLTLARSVLTDHVADHGGAVALSAPDAASLTNVVFTDCTATTDGGAVWISGGTAVVSLVNDTFAGNAAGALGGHVYTTAPVSLVDDLFTEAVDGGGVYGTTEAASDRYYNLVWASSGGDWVGWSDPTGTSGNVATDPLLVAYTADGDPGDDSLFLAAGSPAIDAGSPDLFDPDGSRADIGAYGGPDADIVDEDGDGWFDSVDCDDADASVHPGAAEIAYDAIDQDCTGGDLEDVDGDGHAATLVGGDDCDDDRASVHPGAAETWYDGLDEDCSGGSDFDQDGDGHLVAFVGGDDCDDLDRTVHAGATETWYDGVDQDCDGADDFDQDGDGAEALAYGDDCDDVDAATHPGALDTPYDGIDQDCDGHDLVDVDGDGWIATEAGGTDCDDGDPDVHPGAYEDPSDGRDTDCDGTSEWDHDGDGYVATTYGGDDCDDTNRSIHPGADEVWYDGIDENCSGGDDYDQDRDGYDLGPDCDDLDADVHPGSPEVLDGKDDDCDGWSEADDPDQDGLPTWIEWALGTDPENADTDGDTLLDGLEVTAGPDRDGDGVLDAVDPDDDGDGLDTFTEQTVGVPDFDGDGLLNAWDLDSDADGYPDADEGTADADQDGAPDFVDYQGDWVGGGCGGRFAGTIFLPFGLGALRRRRGRASKTGDAAGEVARDARGGASGDGGEGSDLSAVPRRRVSDRGVSTRVSGQVSTRHDPPPINLLTSTPPRRSTPPPPSDDRAARTLPFALLVGGLALLALLLPDVAHAMDAHGFTLVGTSPQGFLRVGGASPGPAGSWSVGLVGDYADTPLAEALPQGRAPVLADLSTLTLGGGYSFGRVYVDGAVPFVVSGDDPGGGFSAFGDARLGVTGTLLRPDGDGFGLGVQTFAFVPTGDADHYVGDGGPRGAVAAVAQATYGRFDLVAQLGAEAGLGEGSRNVEDGVGPFAGFGAGLGLTEGFAVQAELVAQAPTFDAVPLEAGLTARGRLHAGLWGALGASAGLDEGVGASRYRIVAALGWGHVPKGQDPAPDPVAVAIDAVTDTDGDGIPDAQDLCPGDAETVDGFDDGDGCPELDGDGDGVPFARDLCPTQPILDGQDPATSNGCPQIAEFAGDHIALTQAIYFAEGRAELLPSAETVLAAVTEVMLAHPEVGYFLVEGHTNENGSATYNQRLSDARAYVVGQWLVAHGISPLRVVTKGFGETRPLAPTEDPDALALNRRVEFRVVSMNEIPLDARRLDLPPEVRH